MTRPEDVVLVLCIAAGAVAGFTLTGGAAVGTAVGAAVGMAAAHAVRHRRETHH
jgi:hypothetical protein